MKLSHARLSTLISPTAGMSVAGAILVFLSRFNWLPVNFSPVGSFGFWTPHWWLYGLSIIVFDVVKGGFYPGFLITYLGFAGYWVLGRGAGQSWRRQALFLAMASFWFFLISNLGVWWYWYPHSWQGLWQCYWLALPFYRNTMMGDLLFGYSVLVIKNFLIHFRVRPHIAKLET